MFVCWVPRRKVGHEDTVTLRGQGLGGRLIEEARRHCPQGIKLHVELENPAGRLYERLGFTQKYREMRWLPAPEGTA